MGELANCPRCNALFVKSVKSICDACYKKEEEAYDLVYKFISKKKNRTSSIDEVVEATGVEKDLVLKFVKEKRLRAGDFPNLTYDCEKCGAPIQEGKICSSCASGIQNDLEREKNIEEVQQKNSRDRNHTYYSVGNFKGKS
ncbi:TIGR03826 family flagellar region protein [Pontibacillus marinus]|uniref:Membrane protein n=1 Tax=Pontibacillus marinus BH030004 = DSM 16465 TaxID=1385511 RepID=A0A0A5G110_9BACI|nr:TIGR03826 family flagellar region protein [Pontibacillus marinus]KGX86791.1 membrane protein [Pontibacillus marinus BH030004 = DSM 16465]